jgi:hypothetical protein
VHGTRPPEGPSGLPKADHGGGYGVPLVPLGCAALGVAARAPLGPAPPSETFLD